jgi:hypothetical protein
MTYSGNKDAEQMCLSPGPNGLICTRGSHMGPIHVSDTDEHHYSWRDDGEMNVSWVYRPPGSGLLGHYGRHGTV